MVRASSARDQGWAHGVDRGHREHFVGDALFERAKATFGEQGVVDLIGVSGYYTLVSMVLNVAEIPLPAGVPSPW